MAKNERRVLGVIGGMGPLATQLFYKMIIEMTDAKCDQEHLDMIILSHATIPDRTKAIMEGKSEELFEVLLKDAKMLEENGAANIAIPCNTSHVLADKLQENINIPIINMVRETVEFIDSDIKGSGSKIGILATDGTINTGLYQKALEEKGIIPVVPSESSQKLVMKIIYDGVKNGGEIDCNDFLTIEKEIKEKGCSAAILACTELSCFKEMYKLEPFYVDAMNTLAIRSILASGGKIK